MSNALAVCFVVNLLPLDVETGINASHAVAAATDNEVGEVYFTNEEASEATNWNCRVLVGLAELTVGERPDTVFFISCTLAACGGIWGPSQ